MIIPALHSLSLQCTITAPSAVCLANALQLSGARMRWLFWRVPDGSMWKLPAVSLRTWVRVHTPQYRRTNVPMVAESQMFHFALLKFAFGLRTCCCLKLIAKFACADRHG